MKKVYEFEVYRISGLATVTVENQKNEKEAKEFVLKNAQYFDYKKINYPYIVLEKES